MSIKEIRDVWQKDMNSFGVDGRMDLLTPWDYRILVKELLDRINEGYIMDEKIKNVIHLAFKEKLKSIVTKFTRDFLHEKQLDKKEYSTFSLMQIHNFAHEWVEENIKKEIDENWMSSISIMKKHDD